MLFDDKLQAKCFTELLQDYRQHENYASIKNNKGKTYSSQQGRIQDLHSVGADSTEGHIFFAYRGGTTTSEGSTTISEGGTMT